MIDISIKESYVAGNMFNVSAQNDKSGYNFPPCEAWQVIAVVSALVCNKKLLNVDEIFKNISEVPGK